jgi:hypothetical protein
MFYYVIHHYTLLLCQISIISLHVINLPFPYKAIDVNTKVKCFKIFLKSALLDNIETATKDENGDFT